MRQIISEVYGRFSENGQFLGLSDQAGTPVNNSENRGWASGLEFLPVNSGWAADGTGTITQGQNGLVLSKNGAGGSIVARRYGMALKLRSDSVVTIDAELTGVTNGANLRIELSSDGFTNKSCLLEHIVKVAHGQRLRMSFVASGATLNGGELITNTFNYAGVRLTDAAAGASVKINSISVNAFDKPRLIIDFDDGFISQYSEAFRIMAAAGLIGNLAVIAGQVGTAGYVSESQLREMYAAGWDMMTHGFSTHAQLATEGAVLADVQANMRYLQNAGIDRAARHYVYPGGVVAGFSRSVMQQIGMQTARIVDENVTPTHGGVNQVEALALWSFDISQNRGVANLLAAVDRAIAAGATVRMHGHRVVDTIADPDNELTVADFKTLCTGLRERVRGGLIDNMTISQWWALVA